MDSTRIGKSSRFHESKAFLEQKRAALTSSGSLAYIAHLPWCLQLTLGVTSGREQSTISFVILAVDLETSFKSS